MAVPSKSSFLGRDSEAESCSIISVNSKHAKCGLRVRGLREPAPKALFHELDHARDAVVHLVGIEDVAKMSNIRIENISRVVLELLVAGGLFGGVIVEKRRPDQWQSIPNAVHDPWQSRHARLA
jgi:hypothetical protein